MTIIDVWFLRYEVRQAEFFLSFFAHLPHQQARKSKFGKMKKKKKCLEISFYTSVPKIMIICYTAPEIWHMTDVIIIFYFGLLLPTIIYSSNK